MTTPKKPARKPRERRGWALVWPDGHIEGLLWPTRARARRYASDIYLGDAHLVQVERARLVLDPPRAPKARRK